MGNTNTKESRSGDPSRRSPHTLGLDNGYGPPTHADRPSSRRNRVSRGDLGGILGIGSSTGGPVRANNPPERRETKQEREARRLERERVARLKERERSLKEEHVDGGYLVTLGTYTGPEDFNKPIVRQLQVRQRTHSGRCLTLRCIITDVSYCLDRTQNRAVLARAKRSKRPMGRTPDHRCRPGVANPPC
jgi:hypothetical protein